MANATILLSLHGGNQASNSLRFHNYTIDSVHSLS